MALGLNPRPITRGNILQVDAANPASLATNISRNLLTFPEDLTQASWNTRWGGAGTIVSNADIAPDGSRTADTFTATVGGSGVGQAVNVIAGFTYTFSIYVKSPVNVNLTARTDPSGGAGTAPQNLTVSTDSVNWTRATLTWTETLTTVRYLGITIGNGISFTAWGAQLEVGSTASTYYSANTPSSSLTNQWRDLTNISRNYNTNLTSVEVLVVGGGGAGGSGNGNGYESGGGGGGGVIYNAAYTVAPGMNYPVIVGRGGQPVPSGGTPISNAANSGEDSVFDILRARGGGGGGIGGFSGNDGGSGGGAAYANGPRIRGGWGTQFQGNAGGIPAQITLGDGTNRGGGGGGAGDTGGSGVAGGNGGAGVVYSISGTAQTYAAGGGGNNGIGGVAGAGNGGVTGGSGSNGFGHGGGGGGWDGSSANPIGRGGAGGDGTVIIRYAAPQRATGGVVTAVGGNIIHTFAAGADTFRVSTTNDEARAWGVLTNGVTYDARQGGSLHFDNLDDYVDFPSLPPITDGELSMFAWAYLNSAVAGTFGIWGHYGGNYNGSANNCHFEMNPGSTRLRLGQVNNALLPAFPIQAWTHVGFTSNGFTHTYYVNGVAVQTWSGGVATTSISSGAADSFVVTHLTTPTARFQEGTYVTISGVTPAQFNGTWQITSSTTGQFTVNAVVTPGVATVQGIITFGTGTLLGGVSGSHFIGRSDVGRSWNGRIGHAALYNVRLTADEVAQNFNVLRSRYGI